MPELTLEEDTLGEKCRHFNKLVADAVASKHYELTPIGDTDSDIDNLLKIEIACKARNVDYVIEVMKSKDMLYAATAIKKSTWLITDPQYAHIINPEYLHTQLKPYMTTKAFNKLMLHVRLNLKDESRVEAFYDYFTEYSTKEKWLQNCSVPFIENAIKDYVTLRQFKRLCKKSNHFLTCTSYVDGKREKRGAVYLTMLKSRTTDILNIIEDQNSKLFITEMGKKRTKFLMKTCQQKVLQNIEMYRCTIDMSAVARYMNKNEIKPFLQKNASDLAFSQNHNILFDFIRNMPEEERVDFIQKSFINRTEMLFDKNEMSFIDPIRAYQWYEFFPFDIAFPKISNFIQNESSPSERCAMLSTLISSAKTDPKYITSLLTFVAQKHMNIPFKFKNEFVNNLLTNVSTHELDEATWNILDQIFHSMDVYTDTENDVQLCLESIIVRKVLNDEAVPEVVEQKCTFSSYKNVIKTLNEEQKSKLFNYILNCMMAKTKRTGFADEPAFSETIHVVEKMLILLKDFNKTLADYPFIIEKIQELIKTKVENEWTTDMSCLYNVNKSWRKYMFEESLSLSLCEETCLNALKHKPQLLTRHDKQIHTLRTDDAVSLRRVLAKLRVYWPDSLTPHWTEAYMQSLNKPTGQKAIINGIFLLSPIDQVVQLAKKHVPSDTKINWSDSNQAEISIQRNIAKHLHVARPLVPLDTVLWYAKGDYLQYAVPSLSAVLSNVSEVESREYLPKLLNAPVSLQKFGLRLTYTKFEASEIKHVFSDIWKITKNATIRAVIFEQTFNQLCISKNQNIENELWELLSLFMQDLNSQESSSLYKILSKVKSVPISIRGKYYMKSYEILKSLPESHNCVSYLKKNIAYATHVMELLDEDFVVNKLLSPVESTFCKHNEMYLDVFACFLLCGESEENQLQRFRRIEKAIDEAFQRWHDIHLNCFYVKMLFDNFLKSLVKTFEEYFVRNKTPIPVKLFQEIQSKIQKELPLVENYVLFTVWSLVTEYVKCMKEHASNISNILKSSSSENFWKDIHLEVSPSFGKKVIGYLKEDTEKYSSAIHDLFTEALNRMLYIFNFKDVKLVVLSHMLYDREFIPSYLVVCKCMPNETNDDEKSKRFEILNQIKSHPSPLVGLYYHHHFNIRPQF